MLTMGHHVPPVEESNSPAALSHLQLQTSRDNSTFDLTKSSRGIGLGRQRTDSPPYQHLL
jgi:hypothetical protein